MTSACDPRDGGEQPTAATVVQGLATRLAGLIEEYLLWWLTERGPVLLAERTAQCD